MIKVHAIEESGAAARAEDDLTPDEDTPEEFIDPIMGIDNWVTNMMFLLYFTNTIVF